MAHGHCLSPYKSKLAKTGPLHGIGIGSFMERTSRLQRNHLPGHNLFEGDLTEDIIFLGQQRHQGQAAGIRNPREQAANNTKEQFSIPPSPDLPTER